MPRVIEPEADSHAHAGPLRATWVLFACLLRRLPLFFRSTPKTPLRALGIVALDALHVLRHSEPLSRTRIEALAWLLDFEGCANAALDGKPSSRDEYEALRVRLEGARLGPCVERYLGRLQELESGRPPIGGDRQRFGDVRRYREAVARLSVATAASVALGHPCRDSFHGRPGIAESDDDAEALFRILMQCQVIDDVIDYASDRAASLPSFLTACMPLAQALDLTADAARSYAADARRSPVRSTFPIRLALRIFSGAALFSVSTARLHYRATRQFASQRERVDRDKPQSAGA